MKKYKRIELQVEADQYFAYKLIDVEGFRNIPTEYLDKDTMEKKTAVLHGVIEIGDKSIKLHPGDWVLKLPDGKIQVRKPAEFMADFVES